MVVDARVTLRKQLSTKRGAAVSRRPRRTESGCREHPDPTDELLACERSFGHFLRHWYFRNRETGEWQTFGTLWPGQVRAAEAMEAHPWLFLLKAGKLGFTELECAFDGWVLRFRQQNARVHLFSLDGPASKSLLKIVKDGMRRLPPYMRLRQKVGEAGGDTTTSAAYYGPGGGDDDERTIKSYPATTSAAIDQTATHSHVDELARMPWPEETWSSIESTVPRHGSVHIVTRGAGDQNYTANLWAAAEEGTTPLKPVFARFDERPRWPAVCPGCQHEYHAEDRCEEGDDCPGISQEQATRAWYEERRTMPQQQLYYLAPRIPEEALAGDFEDAFVPIERWDACYDPDLPPLLPGDPIPVVLALDAGVTSDYYAAVIVSRHPADFERPAVRGFKVWRPPEGGEVDFDAPEQWVRALCNGACVRGHARQRKHLPPQPPEGETCEDCEAGNTIPPLNVVQVCFDIYQLHSTVQRLRRDHVVWCYEFDQNAKRLIADYDLRVDILTRQLAHGINPETDPDNELRSHVRNARMKVPKDEDTKLRIVKRGPKSKIDLAVATSMGRDQIMYLNLRRTSG